MSINDKYSIQATYPKDCFTKALPGKYSLLDKLLKMGLPLWVNGKSQNFPFESPGKNFDFLRGEDPFQTKIPTLKKQGKHNLSQMLRGAPTNDVFGFPSNVTSLLF